MRCILIGVEPVPNVRSPVSRRSGVRAGEGRNWGMRARSGDPLTQTLQPPRPAVARSVASAGSLSHESRVNSSPPDSNRWSPPGRAQLDEAQQFRYCPYRRILVNRDHLPAREKRARGTMRIQNFHLPSCRSAPPGVGRRQKNSRNRAPEPLPTHGALRGALASPVQLSDGLFRTKHEPTSVPVALDQTTIGFPPVSSLAGRRRRWRTVRKILRTDKFR